MFPESGELNAEQLLLQLPEFRIEVLIGIGRKREAVWTGEDNRDIVAEKIK